MTIKPVFPPDPAKGWTPEAITDLLMRNDRAVGKALVALLDRQTQDERLHATTRYINGVGFSAFDAGYMTGMARDFTKVGHLTKSQLKFLRTPARGTTPRICKYAGQLADIANAKVERALANMETIQ